MKIATKTWHYLADFVIVLEIRMLGEKFFFTRFNINYFSFCLFENFIRVKRKRKTNGKHRVVACILIYWIKRKHIWLRRIMNLFVFMFSLSMFSSFFFNFENNSTGFVSSLKAKDYSFDSMTRMSKHWLNNMLIWSNMLESISKYEQKSSQNGTLTFSLLLLLLLLLLFFIEN